MLRQGYERMTAVEQRPAAAWSPASCRHNISAVTRKVAAALVIVAGLLASLVSGAAPAGAAMNGTESNLADEMFTQLNNERAARNLPRLTIDSSLDTATRRWAERLEDAGQLSHSSDGRAEIVAYGWNTGQITDAWMRSPGHRHLITDRNLVPASVSVSCDPDGRMWAVVQFRRADTSLGTQSSSPSSPIATASTAGGSCSHPPAGSTATAVSAEMVNAIKRLYRAYFLRDAESAGLHYWSERAATGLTVFQISAFFEDAVEFTRLYGDLTNTEFVDLVYRNVMGRGPDDAGERYWLARIRSGVTRGELMTYFSDSPEYRDITGLG